MPQTAATWDAEGPQPTLQPRTWMKASILPAVSASEARRSAWFMLRFLQAWWAQREGGSQWRFLGTRQAGPKARHMLLAQRMQASRHAFKQRHWLKMC